MSDRFQTSLFDAAEPERIELQGGELQLFPQWIAEAQISTLFQTLREQVPWEQSVLQLYGRARPIPRLNAWFGDPSCGYGYSGHRLSLHPWLPVLAQLRQRLQQDLNIVSNSVLANLYRDGQDSVAWHSDDEPELGINPVIASISLGAERRFSLKPRGQSTLKPLHLSLPSGSLLLMTGATQHNWYHCVPKSSSVNTARISLTFCQIFR